MAQAFSEIADQIPNAHLLVVGPDECDMESVLAGIVHGCEDRYHRVGYTDRPEDYMACADVFCLSSYREGFGSVVIEAAAAGVPAIASKIYGLTDAVVDGETGLLHSPKSIPEIKAALLKLAHEKGLREVMSEKAQQRVHKYFTEDILKSAMHEYYKELF